MSFYVVAYDGETELDYLCGWNWYDFGKCLVSLGEVVEENYKYNVPYASLVSVFEAVDKFMDSEYYENFCKFWKLTEREFENYFWYEAMGMAEVPEDDAGYEDITVPEVTRELRLAYLEYADKFRKEQYEKRAAYRLCVSECVDGIENSYVREGIVDAMSNDNVMLAVSFLETIKNHKCEEITFCLG